MHVEFCDWVYVAQHERAVFLPKRKDQQCQVSDLQFHIAELLQKNSFDINTQASIKLFELYI